MRMKTKTSSKLNPNIGPATASGLNPRKARRAKGQGAPVKMAKGMKKSKKMGY